MNLALRVTWLRVLCVPGFLLCYYLGFPFVAAGLLAIASVSDWLDGYLARKRNEVTSFGAFLDPVADKLIVAVALVVVVQRIPEAAIAVAAAIILTREIAVSALREWMASEGRRDAVAVAYSGKIKTSLQLLALLLLVAPWGAPALLVGKVCLWLAAALGLWSLTGYAVAASRSSPRSGS